MAARPITQLVSSAVIGGVATLALAAPTSAMTVADPSGTGATSGTAGPVTTTGSQARHPTNAPVLPTLTGTLGGLALAGAGAGAVFAVRCRGRRRTGRSV